MFVDTRLIAARAGRAIFMRIQCAALLTLLVACGGGGGSGDSGVVATSEAPATPVVNAPAGPDLSMLLGILAGAPEGEWRMVSLNRFTDVWTPPALRPDAAPYPSAIIEAWSSFAWDSKRAELWIFGGGHANYSGNDTYLWRGATQRWERASLPTQVVSMGIAGHPEYFQTIDGPDHAPVAAHTYDNTLYLPKIDRYITFGGGAYDHGGPFLKKLDALNVRETGPYLFDRNRADGARVGGITGSHVQRDGAFPEILGGNMWSNRDLAANPQAGALYPIQHLGGSTAYAEENGKDVVYIAAMTGASTSPDLYRYVINDVGNAAADSLTRVGSIGGGAIAVDQAASAYDPLRKLFVRLGDATAPVIYWDLSGVLGPDNRDVAVVPVVQGGTFNFADGAGYGLDYDPRRDRFLAWRGGGDVWELLAPTRSGIGNWLLRRLDTPRQAPVPRTDQVGTGVLGKWKYAPNLDAFIALQDSLAGSVWVYKPFAWRDPRASN